MTSTYRERDRYEDSRSVASTHRGERDGTYTKVTRYVIREDDDTRSTHTHTTHRHASPEREPVRETIRITRREVEDRESASPRHNVPSYVEKEFVIRGREDAASSPRRTERVEEDDRSIVLRRTTEHEGSRVDRERSENLIVSRVDDRRDSQRYEYDTYRAGDFDRERDLARYSRTAEYYGPPMQQPQTIIIRQDPIIIRERIRDDDYQIARKSDIEEERSVAGRSVASRSVATTRRDREEEARDEQYFYEKRVRERFDEPPYDDYDRRSRREISPHDSISQVGRRRDRSYSSDDSMVYVKRVERDGYSRESSRENKKDLAAGVIAGVGAAELVRNHRKKEGKETSHGIGRIGQDVGAGAIGAIAAEGIRRYRSKSRRRSRSRGRSESPYSRYGHSERRRSRSRSDSRSKLKTLGALGLGAVAVAAAASLATRKMDEKKKEQKEDRRSRSRRRRSSRSSRGSRNSSVQSLSDLENDPRADDARNPKKRNAKVAAAGAIGAAGAALLERARSRSRARDGEPEEEKSRIEQGIPIVAAGLGTAALAGLYEKNKAKREAEKIQQNEKDRARSRSRSQSQARQRSRGERSDAYYDDQPRNGPENNWGVEYGVGDVSGSNFGPEYHPHPQDQYYSGQSNAVVPAGRRGSRSRSVSRDRRGEMRSQSFSPASDNAGRASAAAAGAGGILAASEHERRKQEKRERKARKREEEHMRQQEASRDPYEDPYGPQSGPQQPWTPPPPNDAYGNQQTFNQYQNQYQNQNPYPPPPGQMPPGLPNHFQPQYQQSPTPQPGNNQFPPQQSYTPQPYNPQAYPPPPQHNMPPGQQGFHNPFPQGPNNFEPPRNRGTPEDNVSAGYPSSQHAPPTTNDRHQFASPDGINNTRSLNTTPIPPAPNPSIHIQPPTNSSSTPNLDIPQTYVPPAERADTPPLDEHGSEKRVSFAPSPKPGTRGLGGSSHHRSNTMDSDDVSPDASRQRRRNQETNRGYEASDDTDFSPNDDRHGNRLGGSREPSRDRGESRRSGQRRLNPEDNNYGSRRRSGDSRRDKHSSRSGASGSSKKNHSDSDSDATIDLPDRFDDKGHKKPEKGEDPVADRIDDIMKGKGAAGKVFGNFMDGLLGPQGRRKGSDAGEGGSRKRRD